MRVQFRLLVLMTSVGMLLAVPPDQLVAQGTASISGTTVDTSQAVIPDSAVVLTNVDTSQSRTSMTSTQGFFQFVDLTPGNYKVEVNKAGFKTWVQSSLVLAVAQQLSIYPQLQVGATSERVEVVAAPPIITTSSSTISNVVDSYQIEQLPLNGRNALQLVALAPGVVSTGTKGQFGATQLTFVSSGGRDIDTNYSLDGGINIDPFYGIANEYPNPEALQEFAITSRNYSARFGRGSTDVSAVTRSGTNQFHGSAYEFLRNTALDSTPYFSTSVPTFHRNQFGGSLGGPIVKEKLFFFLSYQGTKQSGGPGNRVYTTVPLAQRNGDFSGISTPVIDPQTGMQFPGNIIPANRINSQPKAFFQKFLPAPNQGTNAFNFPDVGTLSQHQAITKVDFQATKKDFVFARYFLNDVPQVGYGAGSGSSLDTTWLADLPTKFQNTTIGEVHTFSPTLLNDFRVSYVYSAFGLYPRTAFSLSSLGYGVNTQNAFSQYGLTPDSSLGVAGAFSAYIGAPTRDIMPTTHISDNLSWIKGKHSINAGVEIYRNRINENQNFFTGGALSFNGQFTGVGAADFLLGKYGSYTQIGGLSSRLHQKLPSVYVQDDIKVSPRVTLSAGARWDIVSGYTSEDGQLMSLQPGKQSTVFPLATLGLLFPGDQGIPSDVIGTRWNNIAPRLGLAWDVFGNGRTSLRGGIGSYFVPLTRGITYNRLTLIQPFTLQVGISGGDANNIFAGPPYNGVNPFPKPLPSDKAELKKVPFTPTAGESSLPTNAKTEVTYQWSLSLQQTIWRNGVLEADYVGSSSSHLTTSAEVNPAVYIPGISTPRNTQSRRLYPQIGGVNQVQNVLSANYNGLDLVFNQQVAKGIFVKSSYTWSKALGVGGAETEGSNGPRDPFHYRIDYGPTDSDVNQNWVTSLIWKPLDGHDFGAIGNAVIKGWQLGGIAILHSGTPINLTSGRDNSLTGIGADTPDVLGNYSYGKQSRADQIAHWFNPAAFKQNAIGTFGTLGHNALRAPGYVNVDINIQKNFRFREKYGMEFRSSLYNAFNHANLGAPVTSLTSGTFGSILSATDPRVAEFGARLTF